VKSVAASRANLARRETERAVGILHDGIVAFCKRKWKSDYSMQQYCREQQNEALAKLIPYDKLPDGDERKNTVGRCTSKWVEDGLINWEMVEYCREQQMGAYNSLR